MKLKLFLLVIALLAALLTGMFWYAGLVASEQAQSAVDVS